MQNDQENKEQKVIITGLKIPFWDLVWFMVKLAFASIPAIIIIYAIMTFVSVFIGFIIAPFAGH